MKWLAIGLGASALALAVAAYALTTERSAQSTHAVVVVTAPTSVPVGALAPATNAKPARPVSSAKKAVRRGKHPTLARTCRRRASENSDPTGDDRPNGRHMRGVCRFRGANHEFSDDQAGDNKKGGA